jgi:hypothetical protein
VNRNCAIKITIKNVAEAKCTRLIGLERESLRALKKGKGILLSLSIVVGEDGIEVEIDVEEVEEEIEEFEGILFKELKWSGGAPLLIEDVILVKMGEVNSQLGGAAKNGNRVIRVIVGKLELEGQDFASSFPTFPSLQRTLVGCFALAWSGCLRKRAVFAVLCGTRCYPGRIKQQREEGNKEELKGIK